MSAYLTCYKELVVQPGSKCLRGHQDQFLSPRRREYRGCSQVRLPVVCRAPSWFVCSATLISPAMEDLLPSNIHLPPRRYQPSKFVEYSCRWLTENPGSCSPCLALDNNPIVFSIPGRVASSSLADLDGRAPRYICLEIEPSYQDLIHMQRMLRCYASPSTGMYNPIFRSLPQQSLTNLSQIPLQHPATLVLSRRARTWLFAGTLTLPIWSVS